MPLLKEKIKLEIRVTEGGGRVDKYLSVQTAYSRSQINKMIEQEDILVNHKPTKPSYKLNASDVIEIVKEYQKEEHIKPQKMDIDIVYEDDDIIVINKESGVVVHPGSGNKDNTLANGLLYYTQNLSDVDEERPGIVHRLDKDTSGLMLAAKNNQAHQILSEEFKKHNIKREYIALICGVFPHNKATIDAPIGRDMKNRKKMVVTSQNSKEAITHLTVLKRYKDYTLIKLNLETGRTHQIRVHMAYIGYPIFNDPVYNSKKATEFGQFLHSHTLDFRHPIKNEHLHFEADLPKYFQDMLDSLEEIEN